MAFYTDTILASEPTTFHRLRDVPSNGGAIQDVMGRADLAFSNPTTLTAGTIAIPAYGTDVPAAVEWPTAQAASQRIGGSSNAVFDRGSATADFTMAIWAVRVADSVSGFPTILSLGSDLANSVTLYMNESISRVDSVYRTGNVDTGSGSGTGFTFTVGGPHLFALRWTGSTGMQINIDGVDRGSRVNPSSKWSTLSTTALLTPGTRGNASNWEGTLGDAMFWQRDVPASELLAIYNAGTAAPSGGLPGVVKVLRSGVWQ
jgi:hypothetical protein